MSLKLTTSHGCGEPTLDAIAEGVLYAVDNGASVLNLSLHAYDESEALREALQAAEDNHVIVVCAAGNDAIDSDATPTYPKAYGMGYTFAVGETDNWGHYGGNYGHSVDLAAPGIN